MTSAKPPVLRVTGLTVRFGGLKAVDDVSLDLDTGQVTALVGSNGSGKTTLLNAVSGLVPSTGRVVLAGTDVTSDRPWQRARRGIVRTFQTPRRFERLSVAEELVLSAASRSLDPSGTLLARARAALTGFRVLRPAGRGAAAPDAGLDIGAARAHELERTCASSPAVVLLDEPFSGLRPGQSEEVLRWITRLSAGGSAILLVEHRLDLALAVARQVIALDRGRRVFAGPASGFKDWRASQG
jgi:ABC-type branched-subunit amino acid transport system ATPase component